VAVGQYKDAHTLCTRRQVLERLVLARGAGCGLDTRMIGGRCMQIARIFMGDGPPVVQVMVGGIVEPRHDDAYPGMVEDTAQAHDGHVEGKSPLIDGKEEGRRVEYHVVACCLHGVDVQIVERLPGGGQAQVKYRANARNGTGTVQEVDAQPSLRSNTEQSNARFMPREKLWRQGQTDGVG